MGEVVVTTGILDFGCRKSLMGLTQLELEYERVKYTYWVNQILKLHQGHCLDEFRVSVDLGSISSCDINSWIEFAFLKGVKRLVLNLRSRMCSFSNEKFTFPSIEKLTFFAEQRMGSSVTSCFHPLTAIILKDVNVAREVLEYLFLNCPFLERCSVMGSDILVHLKVFGPLLNLKYLELGVSNLHNVAEIDISAVNLVSFVYRGAKLILHVNNAPCLSELSLRGRCTFMEQTWQDISRVSQLQSLSVNLSSDVLGTDNSKFSGIQESHTIRN